MSNWWKLFFGQTFQHVEEVESCSRSACERAIQDIVDGELRDEENKKAKDEERRQDEWLENRKKKIKGYSMKDKSHRLTKNTFPGLLSMNDYRHLRIATLGRPTSGKSLTVNRILELFDQKPTEEVYCHAQGNINVGAAAFRTTEGPQSIIFVTTPGSGEKYGRSEDECRVCDAIISNKLRHGDYCVEGNIRLRDSPMADQCHGVMFFVSAETVQLWTAPGHLSDREFWEPLRRIFNIRDIVPTTMVTRARDETRGCPLKPNLHNIMRNALGLVESADIHQFPIENVEPRADLLLVHKRLRQELLLALQETICQAELRLYRLELKRYRESRPNEISKYTIAALLQNTAQKYAWTSSRLAELERKVFAEWSKPYYGGDYITTDQFLYMLSDRQVRNRIFRSNAQAKQVDTVVAEFKGYWVSA